MRKRGQSGTNYYNKYTQPETVFVRANVWKNNYLKDSLEHLVRFHWGPYSRDLRPDYYCTHHCVPPWIAVFIASHHAREKGAGGLEEVRSR